MHIYYNKTTFRKLCKMYYLCLKQLFNFSFLKANSQYAVLKSNTELNYGLFSFHHRIVLRLFLLIHRILSGRNPPVLLKQILVLNKNKNEFYKLRINNKVNFMTTQVPISTVISFRTHTC